MFPSNSYNNDNYFDSGSHDDYNDAPNHEYDPVALFSNTPSHLLYDHHLQGPISAPAVTQSSDDYFSLSFSDNNAPDTKYPDAEIVDTNTNSVQTRQNTESYHRLHLPEKAKQKRRTYSTNRIRNRSNLSHSFTNDGAQTNVFDDDQSRQPSGNFYEKTQTGPSSQESNKLQLKENKPAFRLDLDMFNPPISPLHKIKRVPNAFPSPQSESALSKTNSRVDSFGSDILLQHGHDGEVDHLHENVTPLLVPLPAEHDYFGDYNNSDHSNGYNEPTVLGGFLNVSGRVFENPNDFGAKPLEHEKFLYYRGEESKMNTENEKSYAQYNSERSGSNDNDGHRPQANQNPNGAYGQLHSMGTENIHENHYNHNNNNEYGQEIHYNHEHQFDNQQHQANLNQFQYSSSLHNTQHLLNQGTNIHQPSDIKYHKNNDYNDQHQNKQGHSHNYDNDMGSGYQDKQYSISSEINQKHYKPDRDNQYNQYQRMQSDYNQEDRQGGWEMPYQLRTSKVPEGGENSRALDDVNNYYTNEGPISNRVELTSEELLLSKDGKKRKAAKVTVCPVCGKHITRDYSRHIRIHDDAGRFQCIFPPGYCKHKSGKFNRPYDYKKHLLNVHFEFDDPTIKLAHTLAGKVDFEGKCSMCRQKFLGSDWLKKHILTDNESEMCYELQRIRRNYQEEYVQVKGLDKEQKHQLFSSIDKRTQ